MSTAPTTDTLGSIFGPDAFDRRYREARQLHLAGAAVACAGACAVIAAFALVTSLPPLRWLALASGVLPLPWLALAAVWARRSPEFARRLRHGLAATAGAWLLIGIAVGVDGLRLGYETPPENLPQAETAPATPAASRDKEQDAIMAAIERARAEPSPATYRALVPYLDKVSTNLFLDDGSARNTSSLVREILWSDEALLFRTLDEEVRAMVALLPADEVVPEEVTVRVAERLEFALKTLITAHSERVIAKSFDVPSVGIMIDVETDEGVSTREIGITYPHAGVTSGSEVAVNAATVEALLDELRGDLGY